MFKSSMHVYILLHIEINLYSFHHSSPTFLNSNPFPLFFQYLTFLIKNKQFLNASVIYCGTYKSSTSIFSDILRICVYIYMMNFILNIFFQVRFSNKLYFIFRECFILQCNAYDYISFL